MSEIKVNGVEGAMLGAELELDRVTTGYNGAKPGYVSGSREGT